ncbi:MAG: hypothetical protein ACI9EW_000357 [Cellvibrionaceae bacterium]|jgi:hypothetical protein
MSFLVNNSIFVVLILIFLGTLIFNIYSKQRQKEVHHCPKCDSTDVIETGHSTRTSRTVIPSGGGSPAGGDVRLQLDLTLDLRCKACGNGFRKDVTRTY